MPEVTVKLPEPPQGMEWVASDSTDCWYGTGGITSLTKSWKVRPKPAEWVNVRMPKKLAIHLRDQSWSVGEWQEFQRIFTEALAEKCGVHCHNAENWKCLGIPTCPTTCQLPRGHEGPHV